MNRDPAAALDECSMLKRWHDPVTGITSYILRKKAAPVQQSFYFTSNPISDDGRYLWFYCAHPPSGNAEIGRTLGAADFKRETVAHFPDTMFRDGSPLVDARTGAACWCWDYSVYRRSPLPATPAELLNSVPESVHRNRYGKRLATHLTISADGKDFLIDAHLGREWCAGSLPLDGGEFKVWRTFDRCYNHAQFNPRDPDLALIAQDWWIDVATGEHNNLENRIWTLRRNGELAPVFSRANTHAHEWWDPDGNHIWYVNYRDGTEKVNILNGEKTNVWRNGTCHSHSSADGRCLVGDIGTYSWQERGCKVAFFNTVTGREVNIVTGLPLPPYPRNKYHIDPHPRFCLSDSIIVYTTTVMGEVDVAMVKTEELVSATS